MHNFCSACRKKYSDDDDANSWVLRSELCFALYLSDVYIDPMNDHIYLTDDDSDEIIPLVHAASDYFLEVNHDVYKRLGTNTL